MVILHSRATDHSAVALGNRILAAFAEPIVISGKEVVVSASVGIALCKPGMKSAEQLLREADTALYAAKDRGRARLEQFNDELHARAEKRMQIELDLRAALRESQLFVEYQPQVRLKDGMRCRGRGAGPLATSRAWHHPARRLHSRCRGLRTHRQDRTAGAAANPAASLPNGRKLMPGRPLAMTVNVSPRQIAEPDFIPELRQVIADDRHRSHRIVPGNHRKRDDGRDGGGRPAARPNQAAGSFHCDRRFRHRTLVAVAPARHAGRGAEDRSQLHRRPQQRTRRYRDRFIDPESRLRHGQAHNRRGRGKA